ncbi:hypothetical protein ACPTJP_12160 [Pseudomonas aeruginosa]|uniref:hypothetical protein n=1 Tax=Pseudomonas aeruginosa TaxID=287 RepID=UPI0005D377BB|nr:hypothetical protein [Pseudomonas aeruginosa]KJJ20710.1 hypothetical protein HMPREF3150_01294 [Pseudomonas aeruginosa]MBI7024224.1 hypothetical protein [Pseudomonas aeruginosa]MBI9167823.1 hypothetical protein [Pseudomonas aeruginosa]MBX5593777.1 hypothetical protein [Pseudomonas aeruginosa]MCO4021861.1 hypothetical protein [Pseudomonas aeruginosa]
MPVSAQLKRQIEADLHAVAVLFHNDCNLHALALIYSSIDKMAWLYSSDVDHGRREFMQWVDDFMLAGETRPYDSEDLYAARCALLHTGTVESKLYRDGKARRIIYATGPERSYDALQAELEALITAEGAAEENLIVVLWVEVFELWATALQRFEAAIEANPVLMARTTERSKKYPKFTLTEPLSRS